MILEVMHITLRFAVSRSSDRFHRCNVQGSNLHLGLGVSSVFKSWSGVSYSLILKDPTKVLFGEVYDVNSLTSMLAMMPTRPNWLSRKLLQDWWLLAFSVSVRYHIFFAALRLLDWRFQRRTLRKKYDVKRARARTTPTRFAPFSPQLVPTPARVRTDGAHGLPIHTSSYWYFTQVLISVAGSAWKPCFYIPLTAWFLPLSLARLTQFLLQKFTPLSMVPVGNPNFILEMSFLQPF